MDISAGNISIDKKTNNSFENQVSIKDDEKNVITSNYAEYDKTKNFFTLKDNVIAIDKFGNTFKTNFATYDGNLKIFLVQVLLIFQQSKDILLKLRMFL